MYLVRGPKNNQSTLVKLLYPKKLNRPTNLPTTLPKEYKGPKIRLKDLESKQKRPQSPKVHKRLVVQQELKRLQETHLASKQMSSRVTAETFKLEENQQNP
jgi:hypothetical protein